jgi:hypothetical protein
LLRYKMRFPGGFRLILFPLMALLGAGGFSLASCQRERPALFPVRRAGLAALSRDAAAGTLDISRPKKLEYRFDPQSAAPSFASLEIEYSLTPSPGGEIQQQLQLALSISGNSWALPLELAFSGAESGGGENTVFHYAVPVDVFAGGFSIALAPREGKIKIPRDGTAPCFQIRSLELTGRWFGFYRPGNGHAYASPFVFVRGDDRRYVIDPPALFGPEGDVYPTVTLKAPPGQSAALEAGGRRFEALPQAGGLRIPPPLLGAGPGPLAAAGPLEEFRLTYAGLPLFPWPLAADPGLILEWPREMWRNAAWELFRWHDFPSLLIFDTADYAVQDRFFKRLAFFTEKAGFRGRLAGDREIAGLHGWNAHDYRAEDLARFFELARETNFPLSAEERELEKILLAEGIISRDSGGGIIAGSGGIISISRESAAHLRSLFMVHEAFHGLFFIDEDFRRFSRLRWEQLDGGAKRFIISYFEYQRYDITDEYLVINEFMAHILQQPASRAGRYFGQTIPSRLASSWRRGALPEKDEASGSWPALAAAFGAEAEAFSAYVYRRWGLAAGRVWMISAD